MTENMKKFLELVSNNEELSKKMNNATKEDVLAIAKELGVELTDADFAQQSAELSDDDLDAVAGGAQQCVCVGAGGGKAHHRDEIPCACVLGGGGEIKTADGKKARCMCIAAGTGDTAANYE